MSFQPNKYTSTRASGAYGPLVLAPAEGMGALRAPFLSFCLFAFLPFCLFVTTIIITGSNLCSNLTIFQFYHTFYHTFYQKFYHHFFCHFVTTIIIMGSISTTTPIFVPIRQFFQFYHTFYHTFYHKPLPVLPSTPPTMFSVPKRNTGKCFERPAKILKGLQRFGNNLGVGGGGGGLTIWF